MTVNICRLNGPQQSALATAIALDPQDTFTAARQLIRQGSPGTDKSHLIIALVVHCLMSRLRVMVTAASNQAIAVLVARLDALLTTRNQHRNYRIIHLQTETTEDLRAIQVRQQIQDIPALPAIQGPSTQGFRVK